jgi:peroxiredoxin
MGIEPTSEAWEASILPLYDARSIRYFVIIPKNGRARTDASLVGASSTPRAWRPPRAGSVVFSALRYNLAMGILRRLSRWMGSKDDMTHIVAGNTAPEFSLKSLEDKQYALRSLLERGPVVAAFFKISCPVCQFTFPFLERLHQRYGSGGATFLGISQDDARATKSFASEYGVTFRVVLDEDGYPVSNAYGLTNVPTIFLIETDGKVKVSSMGFDKKDLETIAAQLAERRKIALAPLFRPDEVVPANKPG